MKKSLLFLSIAVLGTLGEAQARWVGPILFRHRLYYPHRPLYEAFYSPYPAYYSPMVVVKGAWWK